MKTLSIFQSITDTDKLQLALVGPLSAMHAINIKTPLFEKAVKANKLVELDLKEITQFDISGLNTLITTYRNLKEQGIKLNIIGLVDENLKELLSLTGFHRVLAKAA